MAQAGVVKKVVIAACILICGAGSTFAAAAGAESAKGDGAKVRRLLYVGNSFFYYNNSLHGHVNKLLSAALPKPARDGYRSSSVTISGGHLRWHDVGAYLDSGIGDSDVNENNELVSNPAKEGFDAVLMMDCSRCPYDVATRPVFHEQVRAKSAVVRSKGARPLLFMSWAYSDMPEMIDTVAREYVRAGQENRLQVVPAGLAFKSSLERRPEIALHIADRRHPTLAGTYLAACVVLASVYGIDPVRNSYVAGLNRADAEFLQDVASKVVRDFELGK